MHSVNDVRQIEVHTAEQLVSAPSLLEQEIAVGKLNMYKSAGIDNISEELIQAGGEILLSEIHKLFNSIWNKEELASVEGTYLVSLIRERTMRTERLPLVGEVSTNFCG
jgi:hypothetical protein